MIGLRVVNGARLMLGNSDNAHATDAIRKWARVGNPRVAAKRSWIPGSISNAHSRVLRSLNKADLHSGRSVPTGQAKATAADHPGNNAVVSITSLGFPHVVTFPFVRSTTRSSALFLSYTSVFNYSK